MRFIPPTARETCINWFNSTIHSRFDHPKKGKVIVMVQRLHAEDLPGASHLLRGMKRSNSGCDVALRRF